MERRIASDNRAGIPGSNAVYVDSTGLHTHTHKTDMSDNGANMQCSPSDNIIAHFLPTNYTQSANVVVDTF